MNVVLLNGLFLDDVLAFAAGPMAWTASWHPSNIFSVNALAFAAPRILDERKLAKRKTVCKNGWANMATD